MNTTGHVKQFRKIMLHPVWSQLSPAVYKLMNYCIMQANWKPEIWYDGSQEVVVPVGSFVTSHSDLVRECRLTVKQVRDGLKDLEKLQVIRIGRIRAPGRAHERSLVSLVNYVRYQSVEARDYLPNDKLGQATGQAMGTPSGRRWAGDGQANDAEMDQDSLNLNGINEPAVLNGRPLKEEEFKKGKREEATRARMREYLELHPAKVKQEAASRAYLVAIGDSEDAHAALMDGLRRHLLCSIWTLPDGSLNMAEIEKWHDPERFIVKRTYQDRPSLWKPQADRFRDPNTEAKRILEERQRKRAQTQ